MADYYDHTMLRTWATFSFADVLLGNHYFSSDSTPVEVYLNDEYMGVYLLCEQTQIDNDRVNIYEKRDDETAVEHIGSIPCVGKKTAIALLTATKGMHGFDNFRQVSSRTKIL
jgi:hypothetical protein